MNRYISAQYYYGGEKRNEPQPVFICVDHISAVIAEDDAVLILLTNGLTYKIVGDLKGVKAAMDKALQP